MKDLSGIKNIVFDFGGVLVNLNQQACMDALTRLGVAHIEQYLTPFGHIGPFGAFENGDLDLPQFCQALRELFQLQARDTEIEHAWAAFLEEIPYKKIQLVYALSRRYRVFLLSNTNPIHIKFLYQFDDAGYPVSDCFERLFCSFQMHHSKPSPEAFETVLREAGLEASETLLIDDGPRNCAVAEQLGIRTYCPKTSEDFTEDLFPEEAALIASDAFPRPRFQRCVATLGFFDGVHRGHRYLLDELKTLAKEKRLPSLVMSIWPHPRQVLQSDYCPELLNDAEERLALLKAAGVDAVETLPFDAETAQMTAKEFMQQVLKERYGVTCLLMGHDHRFGKSAPLCFDDYVRLGCELGIEVRRAEALLVPSDWDKQGSLVSSSYIRRCLLDGSPEKASQALGYAYRLAGEVVHAFGNGRKLGFPTANLRLSDPQKLVPLEGVYAVRVQRGEEWCHGMLNIGRRPTMHNGNQCSIEVHLLDVQQDLYGQRLVLHLDKYIRPEYAFPSQERLAAQLRQDEEAIRLFYSAR